MSVDEWLATLDVVLDALPDTIEKEHAERLQMVRDILGVMIVVRQLHR